MGSQAAHTQEPRDCLMCTSFTPWPVSGAGRQKRFEEGEEVPDGLAADVRAPPPALLCASSPSLPSLGLGASGFFLGLSVDLSMELQPQAHFYPKLRTAVSQMGVRDKGYSQLPCPLGIAVLLRVQMDESTSGC